MYTDITIELRKTYPLVNALLPIIIVSFFLLDSMIFNNIKGITFLIGMGFSIMANLFIGNMFEFKQIKDTNITCNPFTINNKTLTTKLPLSTNMLTYTFINLTYTAFVSNFWLQNIFIIILLFLLNVADMFWLSTNSCYTFRHIGISFLIAVVTSLIWSMVIYSVNNKHLIYNLGINTENACQIPNKKSMFIKDIYRNNTT